jgi:hypothetical protein
MQMNAHFCTPYRGVIQIVIEKKIIFLYFKVKCPKSCAVTTLEEDIIAFYTFYQHKEVIFYRLLIWLDACPRTTLEESMNVSPTFNLCELSSLVDDNFIPRSNKYLSSLVNNTERSLDSITIWHESKQQ